MWKGKMMHRSKIPSVNVEVSSKEPEKSVEGHAVPRFSIYKPFSTERVESLIHCFIKNATLDRESLPATILAEDGLVYHAVYDSRIPANMTKIPVVISFQKHTYGRYAVIRVVNEEKRRIFK